MHVGERRWERLAKAKELYEEARRGGDASATSYLGCLYEEEGQLAEAMELYEEARRGGHAGGAYNLGILYQKQ